MARRRRWLACLLVFAAAASGGCSVLLPWDELTGTGPKGWDAGGGDEGIAAEASVVDVAVDRAAEGAADGAPESSQDAPSAPDSPYPEGSWCAMQPPGMAFCDDFDFETTAFERWSSHQLQVQGSGRFSSVAESPPHAFELTSGPITPNTYYLEVLERTIEPVAGTSSISLSFAFQPAAAWDAGGGPDMYVATISQGPGAPRTDVWLELGPDGTVLREMMTGDDGGTSFPPQAASNAVVDAGHWTHVVFVVDFAHATATVSFDGTAAVTTPLQGTWSAAAETNVYLGDWYLTATPGFDLLYDDVVIRQQ